MHFQEGTWELYKSPWRGEQLIHSSLLLLQSLRSPGESLLTFYSNEIPCTELSFALGAFPGDIESQILSSVAGAVLCSQKLGVPVLRSKIYYL